MNKIDLPSFQILNCPCLINPLSLVIILEKIFIKNHKMVTVSNALVKSKNLKLPLFNKSSLTRNNSTNTFKLKYFRGSYRFLSGVKGSGLCSN